MQQDFKNNLCTVPNSVELGYGPVCYKKAFGISASAAKTKSVEYPISTTAKYTAVLPEGEYTGEKFNEFALVDEEGHLCAIENTYTKQKEEDLTMTWEIEDRF